MYLPPNGSASTSTANAGAGDAFGDVRREGLVAGVLGGAVMAVRLLVVNPPTLVRAIPALYGFSGMAAGWAAHLAHGAPFGALFAALSSGTDSRVAAVGIGIGLGLALRFVGAGTVMPIRLQSVGFPGASSLGVPNLQPPILVAHLVYGTVVGVAPPVLSDR